MTQAYWPTTLPQCGNPYAITGGPVDTRASFETELGPAIERARMTSGVDQFGLELPALKAAAFSAFAAWFTGPAARGAARFVWRHPFTDAVSLVQFASGETYQVAKRGTRRDVTLKLLYLPGTPWFAGYVPAGVSVPPDFVADFANAVYGYDDGTLQQVARATVITETDDPAYSGSGVTLDADDGIEIERDDWATGVGTWVITLSGAAGVALEGSTGAADVTGSGAIVVSHDASETVVYASGAVAFTAGAWSVPTTFEPLAGTGTIASAIHYPERLSAARCAALATGTLSATAP